MKGLDRRAVSQVLIAPTGSPLAERAAAASLMVETMPIRNEGDVRALKGIQDRIRRDGFDVLHLHTSQAHGLGAVAARLTGKRRPGIVVTRRVEHSIFRHSFLGLDRLKYAPGADRVICVSERVRQVLLGDGLSADLLAVVPDGVDVARFARPTRSREQVRAELGIPQSAWLVGSVGHLDRGKGHHVLLAALARLGRDGRALWGLLVGEGKEREALEAEATRLGVRDRIVFAGFRSDVPDLLQAMDVFAFPSLHEGLGSALLEAMAARVPVVAARAGGIPEVVRDGVDGLITAPDDDEALAAALLSVFQDEAGACARAVSAAERVASNYSADAMVERTLREYEWVRRARC